MAHGPHGYDVRDEYAALYLERLESLLDRRRFVPRSARRSRSYLDHAIVSSLVMAVEQGRGDEARGLVATYALLPRLREERGP